MTDSVDTDALRTAGRMLAPGFPGVDEAMTAAADEVDRLREVDIINRRLTETVGNLEHERNQLRAVIEDAPHSRACRWLYATSQPCTCWKVAAL